MLINESRAYLPKLQLLFIIRTLAFGAIEEHTGMKILAAGLWPETLGGPASSYLNIHLWNDMKRNTESPVLKKVEDENSCAFFK